MLLWPPPNNALRVSPFWAESIPFASCVVTKFPWNTTNDTPEITGLPMDCLYMAQVETLKMEIQELKSKFGQLVEAVVQDNNRVVKEICERVEKELDLRSVGGEGYGLSREIDRKLNLLISRLDSAPEIRPSPPRPQAPDDEDGDPVIFETCDVEDEIVITFDERAPTVAANRTRIAETRRQLKRRKLTVGLHHGKLNVLPANWKYPKMTMVQLIHLYLMGSPSEGVAALRLCNSAHVGHFDKEGMNLSRMKRVIKVVEHYAKQRGVWKPLTGGSDYWNGETVTKVWDGVWKDMLPLLATRTIFDDGREDSDHKSRVGDISWRTCHNKLFSKGVYKSLGI